MANQFSEAVEANLQTGALLLCKEVLVTALSDHRLERGHRAVLSRIAQNFNWKTGKAWPSVVGMSVALGISVPSIRNTISELVAWGYLIKDREVVDEADGCKVTVYTFGGALDHDTIRQHITQVMRRLQEQRRKKEAQSSPPTVNPNFTAHGDKSSPPTVNFTAHGEDSSPPTVNRNKYKEHIRACAREGANSSPPAVRNVLGVNPPDKPPGSAARSEFENLLFPGPDDEVELATAFYNEQAQKHRYVQCTRLTPPLRKRLTGRLKDIGGLENFKSAVLAVQHHKFLSGKVRQPGRDPFRLDLSVLLQTNGNMGDVLARLLDLAGDGAKPSGTDEGSEDLTEVYAQIRREREADADRS